MGQSDVQQHERRDDRDDTFLAFCAFLAELEREREGEKKMKIAVYAVRLSMCCSHDQVPRGSSSQSVHDQKYPFAVRYSIFFR